jgi:uncharacterized membrane protein
VITAIVDTYYVVKAIHSMTVMVTFGGAFVYPLAFAVVSRHDPRSLPAMHRLEYTLERLLIVPGLLVVILTGIDITSISHHWGMFFVQWGLSATIAIGALVSIVMIPGAERAAALAERDMTASAHEGAVGFSEEYRALARRLLIVGILLSALVLITILFMVVAFNP